MKQFLYTLIVGLLVAAAGSAQVQQELYQRTILPLPALETGSFGNFITGVDLDGDGKMDLYAVDNDLNDTGTELIPSIYKFERNADGSWDTVWSKHLNIPAQNTWPPLTLADLDGDGKQEIVWGPVNFTSSPGIPNPARIIVFESNPGTDVMGVNGEPNTTWTIVNTDNFNLRPFKWYIHTLGGKQKIVFVDRATQAGAYRFGVVSVNDIPNDGNQAGVTWTLEASGKDIGTWPTGTGTGYDIFGLDSTIFVAFDGAANNIIPVSYNNGTYKIHTPVAGLVPGGSWKSASVVDVNNDGKKEVIVAGYNTGATQKKVYLLEKTNDTTLVANTIADLSGVIGAGGRLYGGAAGDIDADGNVDFVVGTRASSPLGIIVRLEYKGSGAIQDNGSWDQSIIERNIAPAGSDIRLDQLQLANIDGVAGDEVIYSATSYTTGTPIVVLSNGKKAVNVTFNVNTSGVPDTLKANSFVQIRGSASTITWGLDSPAKLTNAGGDYWKYTGLFATGDTIAYKLFTNAKAVVPGAEEHNGWEADISSHGNGNRRLIVGASDMNLPVEYVNAMANPNTQGAAPFPNTKTDTVVTYIRVNMQSYPDFNPTIHKVGIRGSFAASGWGTTVIMNQEQPHANGGSRQYTAENFYSVPVYWKKSFLDTASDPDSRLMRFKFVIHLKNAPNDEDWSLMVDNPDYQIEFSNPNKDTTVYWRWYRGIPFFQPPGTDTITLKFRTDLTTAIAQKGFTAGDKVVAKYGYNASAAQIFTDTLVKVGLGGNIYESTPRITPGVSVGKQVLYQYYLVKPDNELREIFYDFDYKGSNAGDAERRKLDVVTKNVSVTIADTSVSITTMRRRPTWQNTSKLTKDVLVTYTVDLRPAYYHLAGGDSLFDVQGAFRTILPSDKDSVYGWGVWMNGPAVGGWGNGAGSDWGVGLRNNLAKKMFDDGTHGDVTAGDHIYSLQVQYKQDSTTLGQVFKFGLYAGDNEGGQGGFGNNHVANIDDALATATIARQFGSINPNYYKAWNYDQQKPTNVQRADNLIPEVFALEQNFPNPFNPSTTIKYSIPIESRVTLKIYNMLGQEVATVVNETMPAGKYTATFTASTLASGAYIYRIEAGSFVSVKKMLLLK